MAGRATTGESGPVSITCVQFTRRWLLTGMGTVAALGAVGGAGSLTDVLPGGPWLRRHLGITGQPGSIPPVPSGDVRLLSRSSTARHKQVDLLIIRPAGFADQPLPTCLALHPLGGTARGMVDLGPFLTAAVAQGARPVTLVAPDGGHYWLDDGQGDDPMRMLTDELPVWLQGLGLPLPSAVMGMSAGGFGALTYGLRRQMRALGVLSPALFQCWSDTLAVQAFPTEAEWAANDPIQHAAQFESNQVGVWCGNADPFYAAASDFAARSHAAVAEFGPGDHTAGYWYRVLPTALHFVTDRLG